MLEGKLFCNKCDKEVSVNYEIKEVVQKINNEDIFIEAKIPYCKECNEELSDLDLEEIRYDLAFDKYRRLKKLLSSNEIKDIREKYGLSQRAFSRVLGFAESTINRYELGAIQANTHNMVILFSKYPNNMIMLLNQNGDNLSDNEKRVLEVRINEIMSEDIEYNGEEQNIIFKDAMNRLINTVDEMSKKINSIDLRLEQYGNVLEKGASNNSEAWPTLDSYGLMGTFEGFGNFN